jgi:hypothetical protein
MRKFLSVAILGLALVIPPGSAFSLTMSEVRNEARKLALDAGTRTRFTDAQLLAFANEGQRQAVVSARSIIKSFQFQSVSGTTYYAMPSDFLQVYRVTGDYDLIDEATPEAIDKSDGWQEISGDPTHYFVHWATRTYIGLYPYPDSVSTGTIRVEYYAQVADLSGDSSIPFNGIRELYPYHYSVAYFTAAMMSAIDGRQDLATIYMAQYAAVVDKMGKEAMNRPNYKPGLIGAGSGSGRGRLVP